MKKNAEIRISLTTDELEKIKSKAKKCGMSIKGFLLYLGLNTEIIIKSRVGIFSESLFKGKRR
ncbi:hypothetical protein ES703_88047 [subsurface metagenome]